MPFSFGLFIHTAGPDVALIKSSGKKSTEIVIGGRMCSIPIIQRVDWLSLRLRTIIVQTHKGLTYNGVTVNVTAVCQVKIQGWKSMSGDYTAAPTPEAKAKSGNSMEIDYDAIRLAAQHFLGRSDTQMEGTIQQAIAGHQRALISSLTVEQLYQDRAAFCGQVIELISEDMRNMGLAVVSYSVSDISDGNGYIEALGVTETETVKRKAAEGTALHQGAARAYSASVERNAYVGTNIQNERKIKSNMDRQIAKASAEIQVQKEVAKANKSHQISSAQQDAYLFVAKQNSRAAETKAELDVVKYQVELEKLKKEKQVHVEADAMLYQATVRANSVREASGADAERVRLIGDAEAESIRYKGLAEVEVLRERNRAWTESINSGAILEKVTEALPTVANAISAPLGRTQKMVFISGDDDYSGDDSSSPAPSNYIQNVAQTPDVVNALSGVDITQIVNNFIGGGIDSSPLEPNGKVSVQ